MKIIIAAGGTGGHVFPGIALAEALGELNSGVEVLFVGTSNGPEAALIPQSGWPLRTIGGSSTHGGGFMNRMKSYLRVPGAMVRAWRLLRMEKPDMVIGTGGFATGPMVLAASIRGIHTAIVEPNAIAGRTNRILSHFVDRVFLGFSSAANVFPKGKSIVTGNPVRKDIASVEKRTYDGSHAMTILCYGGSQGARRLNEIMVDAISHLKDYSERLRFIHQVGKASPVEEIATIYRRNSFESEVFVFTDQMASLYQEADLVVARAGAGTVAEVAALRMPSVLVPLPHAVDDHQSANAEELAKAKGALLISESDLDGEKLAKLIVDFLEHPEKLKAMSDGLAVVGHPEAARRIASNCYDLLSTD